jgi:hypothetical protein
MPILKNKVEIATLNDWKELAGPKAKYQWADDRSAKEVARAWIEGGGTHLPREVANVLSSHLDFGEVESWIAEPEAKLKFDNFRGETRNTDLAVYAKDQFGDYVLAIEAKADEPFSDLVATTLADALERKLKSQRSNGLFRAEQLAAAILGPRQPKEPNVGELRYQLLTACAGVLCEAERKCCSRAVMLVQEFFTNRTDDKKHQQNEYDLERFMRRLAHDQNFSLKSNNIYGPFVVPGEPLIKTAIKLYVGKVSRSIRGNMA